MTNTSTESPLTTYGRHLSKGELAYQFDPDQGRAIFYPRVIPEGSGIEWRVSKGLGTVYSSTVVFPRGGTPYNVALIELDEGFRMMSRVETEDPMEVTIGQRVQARILPAVGEEHPLVVFDRVDG